jgi:phosphoribosylformylglycinamidine synthase subunit PurS
MYLAKIVIRLRESILDPQGKAVEHSLKALGFNAILDTRIGKYIELKIDAENEEDAKILVEGACDKLLANPVMEDFEYKIEELKEELA